jgi:hypothetical protein
VQRFAISEGLASLLDWQGIEEVVRLKKAVVQEVSRPPHALYTNPFEGLTIARPEPDDSLRSLLIPACHRVARA